MTALDVELLDRTLIHRTGSRLQRGRLHAQIADLKRKSIARRRELAAPYLHGTEVISEATALGALDLRDSPLAQEALEEAYRLASARGDQVQREKGSIDYLAGNEDFDEHSAAVRLAVSPTLLAPVVRYLGMLPILFRIEMTRANATRFVPNSTHMFHLDPEDVRQVKAFIHLSHVDEGCGPFNALPANLSDEVVEQTGYREGRVEDVEVDAIVGPDRTFKSVGPPLTVTLCDTSRCFHFGGRPGAPGKPKRDMLVIDYVLPTCFKFPRFEGDGKPPPLMPLLRPNDDATWNALIGAANM